MNTIPMTYTKTETKITRYNKKGHAKLLPVEKERNKRIQNNKKNKKMNNHKEYRSYQAEADDAVYQELLLENRCCVNMFCGSGKSLVMRKCKSAQGLKLLVYVFPTLGLINQFSKDYFTEVGDPPPFTISSEFGSTTDPALVRTELALALVSNRIFCVTYQIGRAHV